jgi:hypothetical protein
MKRRLLLLSTLASTASAGIFTATGWLMGTKSLTMAPPYHGKAQPYPDCCMFCQTSVIPDGYHGCYNRPQPCGGASQGNCFASCYDYWCCDSSHWCDTWCYSNMSRECCSEAACY